MNSNSQIDIELASVHCAACRLYRRYLRTSKNLIKLLRKIDIIGHIEKYCFQPRARTLWKHPRIWTKTNLGSNYYALLIQQLMPLICLFAKLHSLRKLLLLQTLNAIASTAFYRSVKWRVLLKGFTAFKYKANRGTSSIGENRSSWTLTLAKKLHTYLPGRARTAIPRACK